MPNRPMSMFHTPRAPIVMLIAKTRPSHGWWKTGSSWFGLHGAESVHAAEVVHAVHQPTAWSAGTPTPIMQSRPTSLVSRFSAQPSVPAGRIGSTR